MISSLAFKTRGFFISRSGQCLLLVFFEYLPANVRAFLFVPISTLALSERLFARAAKRLSHFGSIRQIDMQESYRERE